VDDSLEGCEDVSDDVEMMYPYMCVPFFIYALSFSLIDIGVD
jgi:hypothetical protein